MALSYLEVHRVVARRDLQRSGAKGWVNRLVANDGKGSVQDGQQHTLAQQVLISVIVWIDGHRGIAQQSFRARGGYGYEAVALLKGVSDVIKKRLLLLVVYLKVR